ncbi:MAG: hypothetical protein INQ03_05660 [Candidatus Heimdallarchaeota archaeon]|nr:hypothetical protein [Candidatus Heimdallarchaeota archaeon]
MEYSGRKILAIASTFIIIFVPSYSQVYTYHIITKYYIHEYTWYWPWLTLIHKVPTEKYLADQWTASGLPSSLIVFFPSYYGLRHCYILFKSEKKKVFHSTLIAASAIGQGIILYVMSRSQNEPKYRVEETVNIYYFPQILLLVLNGLYLAVNLYLKQRSD